MAKDDQQEAYERLLSSSLTRAVDFLKFAETKNAALLTFSSAWLLGCLNFLVGSNPAPADWRTVLQLAIALFGLAGLIALASFLPKLRLERWHQDPEQKKSLLYFGDVATFAPGVFIERVRTRYYPPPEKSASDSYLDDIAIQIVVISQIARAKFRLFNVAASVVLCAVAALAAKPTQSILTHILSLTLGGK